MRSSKAQAFSVAVYAELQVTESGWHPKLPTHGTIVHTTVRLHDTQREATSATASANVRSPSRVWEGNRARTMRIGIAADHHVYTHDSVCTICAV